MRALTAPTVMRWTLVLALVLPFEAVWAQPSRRAVEGAKQRLRMTVEGAEDALRFAHGVFRQIEALDPRQADEELTARLGAADQAVRLARAVLENSEAALADVQEAERETTTAAGELARLRRDLPARLGAVQRAQRELISKIQAHNRDARRLLDDTRLQGSAEYRELLTVSQRVPYVDREVPVPELERLVSRFGDAVEAYRAKQAEADRRAEDSSGGGRDRPPSGAKADKTTGAGDGELAEKKTQQRSADATGEHAETGGADLPAAPSRDLREAGRALLAGDYERTLRILRSVREEDDRSRATRLLLEAAASHGRYLLAGARDPQQLAAIESMVVRLLALIPDLDLEGSDLSPRFVRLVQRLQAETP